MKNLPGDKEAYELGYDLMSHTGNNASASYGKNGILLTVNKNRTASLFSSYKMVQFRIDKFSFPNKNFKLFEDQMAEVIRRVN